MKIGLIKEIKTEEYRVGLTPQSAGEYVKNGHTVLVEKSAGEGSGFSDEEYAQNGCTIEPDKKKIYDTGDMIVKVKEPLEEEYDLYHEDQLLYTYLHIAADKPQAEFLVNKKINSIAYETVQEDDGSLPLLKPMSEIAGRLSTQEGAKYLEKAFGGRGVLLGGVPGIRRGKVAILGGGIVGTNACQIAVGMGAEVVILDISSERMTYLDDIFGTSITTLYSNTTNIEQCISEADLVIGAVLIPGAAAPKLVNREQLKLMKKGAVLVDVAIDQGGCFETSKPTFHSNPTYIVEDVVHYCVANMPGVVALSSTYALTSVTNRYGLQIANKGLEKAAEDSNAIKLGINTYKGKLTNEPVAVALDMQYTPYGE